MRKSFIFLAFILVFALGQGVFAQDCSIDISNVAPVLGSGNLQNDVQVTVSIDLSAACLPAGDKYSPTNGFRLYSPDGAAFGQVGGSITTGFDNLGWNSGPFNNYFLWNGSSWSKQFTVPFGTTNGDSVGVMWGAVTQDPSNGLDNSFDGTVLNFFFTPQEADSNLHICIDTATVPGAVWKWAPLDITADPVYPLWGGGICYQIEYVPNKTPVIENYGDFPASFDHCSPATFTFHVVDPDSGVVTTVNNFTGPGTIDAGTTGAHPWEKDFVWTWNDPDQNATINFNLSFCDGQGCAQDSAFTFNTTNAAPVCSAPAGPLSVSAGTAKTQTVTATDDCDVMTYTLGNMYLDGSATPSVPTGSVNIVTAGDNLSADVTFNPDAADEGVWAIEVIVSDGDKQDVCVLNWEVIIGGAYGVEITKIEDQIQGMFTELPVVLTKMDTTQGLGGFDLLIAYDPTCLVFQQAIEAEGIYGEAPNCGWEYFTYRFGPYGNCGSACPSGMVQVIGMAEQNDGANHPLCDVPFFPDPLADPPVTLPLFSLKFLVSNDRTLNCQFCPVRFFWYDCTNNGLSNADGSKFYTSVGVYDYDNPNPINSLDVDFPTYLGAQEECYDGKKDTAEANVDFQNGGVDIVCSDSIDAPGDININGLPYEIADAVMFTNYFIQGPTAFGPTAANHQDASIAASDANQDGVPLTVSDLVYLIRVVVGDAIPYAKVDVKTVSTSYSVNDGVLNVKGDMGAALVVVSGNATASALGNVQVQQGLVNGNTQILVTGFDAAAETFSSFTGDFLEVNGDIISVEFAAADGSMVNASNVPTRFEVFQNYPNPFNPTTKISFNNPEKRDWNVTFYNIAGQTVDRVSGSGEAQVEFEWDASNLASGIYFYKVVAGDNVQTKKAVLLK